MTQRTYGILACAVAVLLLGTTASAQGLTPKEALGKMIFFDANLSEPVGQACAACHAPETGFTGPSSVVNNTTVVYEGAFPGRFGNRKPPTAAYGGESPVMYAEGKEDDLLFVGGMFWDGRATGWELGDPLAEQARGPFLNPMEQNLPSKGALIQKIHASSYAADFVAVYGEIWSDTVLAYNKVADAISAYEKSSEVNPFTSKFDYYLKGLVKLSKEERKGLALFNGKGKCSKCHISKAPGREPPLFTDFTYDNLGIPKNDVFPFNGQPPDLGLGAFLETVPQYADLAEDNYGKHKVPTLRNVDLRPSPGFIKAYGHNGYFKTLKDIIHFYNTRDVESWPAPEVPENVNTSELGNLRLTSDDEDAIIAFLKTLSDGYELPAPGKVPVAGLPAELALLQNSPNPFNPATLIQFELPAADHITLRVYNILGQEVATLMDGIVDAGVRSVVFDASELPSGVYLYRLQSSTFSQVKKMVFMK